MTTTNQVPVADTLFLIGTGVEEGGWSPVLDAINEVYGAGTVETTQDANFLFAQHVYNRTLPSAFAQVGEFDREKVASAERELKEHDLKLKAVIAEHLQRATASRKIRLRRRFQEALRENRFGSSHLFLTSNWDLVLETAVPKTAIIHVHGDVSSPENLFLPTEITPAGYRSKEEHALMGKAVGALWQVVAVAKNICFFGLSLSALDQELAFAVGVGLKDKPDLERRITIFALANEPREIERRIKLLSNGNPKIKFTLEPQ